MSCVDHREAILGVTAQWRSWITPRVRPCEDHPTPLRYLYMAKHTEELSGMDTAYISHFPRLLAVIMQAQKPGLGTPPKSGSLSWAETPCTPSRRNHI